MQRYKDPTVSKDAPVAKSTDDSNWQTTKKSVCERTAAMFNNELMADIRFRVGTDDHIQTVPAHKFVLATGSPVFYAMFYGSLAEDKSEICVPDVEPSAFLTLLKYLYSDEINLNGNNVLATLYLAKKYNVPHLEQACVDYLETNLTAENACILLSQLRLFEYPDLGERCWAIIEIQTEAAVKSEGFVDIDLETLESILSRETLSCREIDLFEATIKWAYATCKKFNIKPTAKSMRDILGQAFYMIRYPTMTIDEFGNRVAYLEILTAEESNNIFRYIATIKKPYIFKFRTKFRKEFKTQICNRLNQNVTYGGYYDSYHHFTKGSIEFIVNKMILLSGFGLKKSTLCSRSTLNSKVKINLIQNGRILAETDTKFVTNKSTGDFNLMFRSHIKIDPNIFCTASIDVCDNNIRIYDYKGKTEVYVGNTTFHFSSSNNYNPIQELIFYQINE